nr:MAG TPA: hypothetical protein [Caudoviricetes sp.]
MSCHLPFYFKIKPSPFRLVVIAASFIKLIIVSALSNKNDSNF